MENSVQLHPPLLWATPQPPPIPQTHYVQPVPHSHVTQPQCVPMGKCWNCLSMCTYELMLVKAFHVDFQVTIKSDEVGLSIS